MDIFNPNFGQNVPIAGGLWQRLGAGMGQPPVMNGNPWRFGSRGFNPPNQGHYPWPHPPVAAPGTPRTPLPPGASAGQYPWPWNGGPTNFTPGQPHKLGVTLPKGITGGPMPPMRPRPASPHQIGTGRM